LYRFIVSCFCFICLVIFASCSDNATVKPDITSAEYGNVPTDSADEPYSEPDSPTTSMRASITKPIAIDSATDVSTGFDDNQSNGANSHPFSLRIEACIADKLPAFIFDISESWEEGAKHNTYKIRIACPEQPQIISQEFLITSIFEDGISESEFTLVDIDFDGYKDIQLVNNRGPVNVGWEYYRWDSLSCKYEEVPFFEMGGISFEVFNDSKQIVATVHQSISLYDRILYQYADGNFVETRREHAEFCDGSSDGSDSYDVVLRIMEGNDVICIRTLTLDEYFAIDPDRDDVLRFGVEGNPSQPKPAGVTVLLDREWIKNNHQLRRSAHHMG